MELWVEEDTEAQRFCLLLHAPLLMLKSLCLKDTAAIAAPSSIIALSILYFWTLQHETSLARGCDTPLETKLTEAILCYA